MPHRAVSTQIEILLQETCALRRKNIAIMKIYSKTKFKRSTSVCFRSKTYLLFDTLINNLLKQLRTLLVPIWRNPRFDVFFYNGVSGKKYWWRVPNKIAWPVSGWGFIISLHAVELKTNWRKRFYADRSLTKGWWSELLGR